MSRALIDFFDCWIASERALITHAINNPKHLDDKTNAFHHTGITHFLETVTFFSKTFLGLIKIKRGSVHRHRITIFSTRAEFRGCGKTKRHFCLTKYSFNKHFFQSSSAFCEKNCFVFATHFLRLKKDMKRM